MNNENNENKEINILRAKLFCEKKIPVHVAKNDGSWFNGIIVEVGSDFFFIDDKKNGRELVFFLELHKRIEEYTGEWGE